MSFARVENPRALLAASGAHTPLIARLASHTACRAGADTRARLPPPAPQRRGQGAGGQRANSASPRRGNLLVAAAFGGSGSYDPYPFDEREYHHVALQMVQVGAAALDPPSGKCGAVFR